VQHAGRAGWISRAHSIVVATARLCNWRHDAEMFEEGVPTYPDASRCWDSRRPKHKVNISLHRA